MRGRPVHGFRLTKQRIARGVTSADLMAKLKEIQTAQRAGKKLSPSLLQASKQIARNVERARKAHLLDTSIDGLHAVEKSAIRRQALGVLSRP
jgi:hypothetical protein